MGFRLMTERAKRLAGLPLQDYIAETVKGRLFAVDGPGWESVATNAVAAARKQPLGREWQRRLPSDKYPSGVLFFRPDEAPVNRLASLFAGSREPVYLRLDAAGEPLYLKVEYRAYSNEDFHLGGGFSSAPTPPTDFLFPGRKWSPWVAAAGLALYVLLPWPKRPPGAQAFRRWRVVATDVVALLMTVPFFAFPFFITGGTVQAFTEGWPLFFFFWPILLIGLVLVWLAAWVSAFALQVTPEGLRIWTDRGERAFAYCEMECFQPVVTRPPKWLIALSWLAALSGKGSSRIGATGRAMILGSSAWGSLAIRLKNGREIFLGITDQLGTDMIGADAIVDALRKAGVREVDEVREIRSLGLEMVRLPE
ncbi:MAG: hypothetical protein A4E67_01056 [Syntrophaceae bacterium PtaB.Bin038]|nr:MAG: hypothetical protein A4E67_01056 [Syntrophaceae bacterium PtaB.Bin038]